MGSNDDEEEKPIHTVTVKPFAMDLTPVTAAAFGACVSAGSCSAPDGPDDPECNFGKRDRQNHPMNCVDCNNATAYCAWVGKRLPTEEEWEFAARGTEGRTWPWGNQPSEALCWKRSEGTCPVDRFPAGLFGLFDMAGNVTQFTATRYCPYSNPGCATDDLVARGSTWRASRLASTRGALRHKVGCMPWSDLGFRCARGE